MQTTLRIDDSLYREAKAGAAREGITITRFIEEALQLRITGKARPLKIDREAVERDRMMEALLKRTAHFRKGPKPTREEMNAR
jgi:antitoxin component of RelBE/YafQ-DinJ toxin-antitoxin module